MPHETSVTHFYKVSTGGLLTNSSALPRTMSPIRLFSCRGTTVSLRSLVQAPCSSSHSIYQATVLAIPPDYSLHKIKPHDLPPPLASSNNEVVPLKSFTSQLDTTQQSILRQGDTTRSRLKNLTL